MIRKLIKNLTNVIYSILFSIRNTTCWGSFFVGWGGAKMNSKIKYRVNYKKAIEIIVWLANQKPNIDIYHIAKVLFYAEKDHLNLYARPIIGDAYICHEYGPFPSTILNLIHQEERWIDPIYLENINKSIKVSRDKFPRITPLRQPDLDFFSETDINCLIKALRNYGDLSFDELKNLTHEEKSYYGTDLLNSIDYALMIDNTNPDYDWIVKEINEIAQYTEL